MNTIRSLKTVSLIFLSLILFNLVQAQQIEFHTLLSPLDSLQIMKKPPAADYTIMDGKGVLSELPEYDESEYKNWHVDVRSCDLTNLDLSDRLDDLMFADFDSKTKWPVSLPTMLNPDKIMELGMDPGLSVRELHKKGITGEKIGIAIIDQPLLVDHIEYKDQIRSYEEIHWMSRSNAQMHGPAVASIAVGKKVGVAPNADLYFIACWMGDFNENNKFEYNLEYVAQSIERIININRTLSDDRKIRVISISLGLNSGMNNYEMAMEAIKKAEEDNIVTLYVGSYPILGLGREPLADPNLMSSYSAGLFWRNQDRIDSTRLLVPMDSRCTASPTGNSDYAFYRSGGMSWAVPYLAGLYTLACQCNPSIKFSEFWDLLVESSIPIKEDDKIMGKAIDPSCLAELKR